MDSCEAVEQALVVHPTTGAVQTTTKSAGVTATAAAVPSTTTMGAGPVAATVEAASATAMGTK